MGGFHEMFPKKQKYKKVKAERIQKGQTKASNNHYI